MIRGSGSGGDGGAVTWDAAGCGWRSSWRAVVAASAAGRASGRLPARWWSSRRLIVAAAVVIRSPAVRMAAAGWARGSLPAHVCGLEKACSAWTPCRAQMMNATESASAFRMPWQPEVVVPGG